MVEGRVGPRRTGGPRVGASPRPRRRPASAGRTSTGTTTLNLTAAGKYNLILHEFIIRKRFYSRFVLFVLKLCAFLRIFMDIHSFMDILYPPSFCGLLSIPIGGFFLPKLFSIVCWQIFYVPADR